MASAQGCCPELDGFVCRHLDLLLGQYKKSPKLIGIIESFLNQLDEIRCLLIEDCNASLDCTELSGNGLDRIGALVGFPRFHCNAICDPCSPIGVSDYTLDDDLYCSFIQAQIITNNNPCTVAAMEMAIQALWGPDAVVVHSGGGSVGVWPGRTLSPTEQNLYSLYADVLPLCLGVNLIIYDTDQAIPSWCCPTATWCDAVPACVLQDCSKLTPSNLEPMTLCIDFCDCETKIKADESCTDNPPKLTFTNCACDSAIEADGP